MKTAHLPLVAMYGSGTDNMAIPTVSGVICEARASHGGTCIDITIVCMYVFDGTHAPDDRECVSQSQRVFVLTKTMTRLPWGLLAMYSCSASSLSGP